MSKEILEHIKTILAVIPEKLGAISTLMRKERLSMSEKQRI